MHRELPRYMQTVTDNQEQTVLAARETVENYLGSHGKHQFISKFMDLIF